MPHTVHPLRFSGLLQLGPWLRLALLCLVLSFLPALSLAAEPSLPQGLQSQEAQPQEPDLPSSLGPKPSGTGPDLPQGLGSESEKQEPDLPSGLSGGSRPEPELPTGLSPQTPQADTETGTEQAAGSALPPVHGYLEGRFGPRLQPDPAQSKGATLGEARLQLESEKYWDFGSLDLTADFVLDGVTEEADLDLRRLRFTFSPAPSVDVRLGRQVLSWGTGDLIFINDLFPKDWVSFLSGRDVEYLKSPGDTVRVGWFTDLVNVNLVYTPRFDPDRYVDGERLSYWNPSLGRIAGEDNQVRTIEPDEWFTDDEIALRVYKNISGYELALYSYFGFWKSPAGQDAQTGRAVFPELNVYGASMQGTVGPGIGNIEIGYYHSRQDQDGDDPFVDNSELRILLGYEQELATEFTAGLQYYLEHMMDYDQYRNTLPPGLEARDEDRHLLTLRLTKQLFRQDLTLSLFTFYSPSDQDAYLRPKASYEISDAWTVETGGNLFTGEERHTFFGQFEDNSNWYLGLRYAF